MANLASVREPLLIGVHMRCMVQLLCRPMTLFHHHRLQPSYGQQFAYKNFGCLAMANKYTCTLPHGDTNTQTH